MLYHVVLQRTVLKEENKVSDEADEHALHASYIWKKVKESVHVSVNLELAQAHFQSYVHLHISVSGVRQGLRTLYLEDGCVRQLSQIVQVYETVLQI